MSKEEELFKPSKFSFGFSATEEKGEDQESSKEKEASKEPGLGTKLETILTLEEDEDVLLNVRARIYRFDTKENMWKERGTGDCKLLQHKEHRKTRVLIRRDKTRKICANHYLVPCMKLEPNCGSDKSWVYSCPADYADRGKGELVKSAEVFAIRFPSAEDATRFKEVFEKQRDENEKLMEAEEEKAE